MSNAIEFEQPTHKRCSKCGERKPQTAEYFNRHRKRSDGLQCYCRECKKRYYVDNREHHLKLKKQWNRDNRERKKQWKAEHREEVNNRNRERRQSDPLYQARKNATLRIWNALKSGMAGKNDRYNAELQCSPNEFAKHIEQQFWGGMCWSNYGTVWNNDHLIPLGSQTTVEGVKALNVYTNIQPCFISHNREKWNRLPMSLRLPAP